MTSSFRGKSIAIALTIVLLVILLFPFLVMVSTMLRSSEEIFVTPPRWIPERVVFTNFIEVWDQYDLIVYFKSSFIIAIGATLLNACLTVPAAYAISRLRFAGRGVILFLFLVVQMFSPVIVVISLFKIMAGAGLLDTYLSMILAIAVFTIAFTIWMMSGYFRSIPLEVEEAAMIDGCTRVQTMVRVMLPIAAPGVVTAMIYTFIYGWNEFLFGLSFIQSKGKMPLTIALFNFVGRWSTQWELLTTAAFLAIIPVLVLFYLIEKQLVTGLTGGAVKQ
jgi:multiple sugar transport system permease protein